MGSAYIKGVIQLMKYYKSLAEQTFNQLEEQELFWQFNSQSNSIAMIVNHLSGNMLSRWTDFLYTDGEKPSRNRDLEFEDIIKDKATLLTKWNDGWVCFLNALSSLEESDLDKTIYIRNQGHTVMEAINRQLAHYPYHIGQIVSIGKMRCQEPWNSLSIPKGGSDGFNKEKFAKEKDTVHFTDEFLNKEG